MPGIAAVIGPLYSSSLLDSMVKTVSHEPFYKVNRFEDAKLFVGVACIGPSFLNPGSQPVWNENRTLVGMMEGEILNNEGARHELSDSGRRLSGGNDLNILIRLFEEKGESFLKGIKGHFTLIFIDTRNARVWIATDRLGFSPLFYAQIGDSLLVASEVKAILAEKSLDRTIDDISLKESFHYNTVAGNRTLFRKIHRFPPAAIWSFERGRLNKKRYWDAHSLIELPEYDEQEYFQRGEELLRISVNEACKNGNVGLSVTAGWDTRVLASLISPDRRSIPFFTLTGPRQRCVDTRIGTAVASASGHPHYEIQIPDDFFRRFPREAERAVFISDGMAGIERTHELILNAGAREYSAVRVTGTHASQILSGTSLIRNRLPDLRFFHPDFLTFLQEPSGEGLEEFLRSVQENRIGRREILLFLLNQEIRQGTSAGNHALERSQIWVRTPYIDEDFVAAVFRAPGCPAGNIIGERLLHKSTGDRIRYRLRGELRSDPCKSLQRWILSRNGQRLRKIPINLGEEPLAWSGICGSFWRSYSRIRGLADKFHDSFEYPGITAPVDRLLQCTGLQSLFVGFSSYVNYRIWMMAELKEYVSAILLDSRTLGRGFFDRRFLERAVNDHCAGRHCYSNVFIKLISFELWNRLFVDSP